MPQPTTPLAICNRALIDAEQDVLASWEVATPNADRLTAVADDTAREVLYRAFWKSGRKVLQLTHDAMLLQDHADYPYAYALPDDVVRVWRTSGCGQWEVRKPVLLSRNGPLLAATVVCFPHIAGWSDGLAAAVAAAIAVRIAPKCGLEESSIDRLVKRADQLLASAKVAEGAEGSPQSAQPMDFVRLRGNAWPMPLVSVTPQPIG